MVTAPPAPRHSGAGKPRQTAHQRCASRHPEGSDRRGRAYQMVQSLTLVEAFRPGTARIIGALRCAGAASGKHACRLAPMTALACMRLNSQKKLHRWPSTASQKHYSVTKRPVSSLIDIVPGCCNDAERRASMRCLIQKRRGLIGKAGWLCECGCVLLQCPITCVTTKLS